MRTPTVAQLFEQRANDKCGEYRCPMSDKYCPCREWAMERADPAIKKWVQERTELFDRSTNDATH
jgi:polyferredoxin